MIHNMKLKPHPFEMISKGLKTYELRLCDEKRRLINIGDTIVFALADNPERTLTTTVTSLHHFESFCELYEALPLEKCGYTARTVREASPMDMLEYYSHEMQQKYGVLAIGIALVDN